MTFEFATAGRIVFGLGKSAQLGPLIAEQGLGRRLLVVTGARADRARAAIDSVRAVADGLIFAHTTGEPTIAAAAGAASLARAARCDAVVGIGGGSVIDLAKAAATLLTNPDDVFEFLEVIGRGKPLPLPAAPCIAVPTTAGTGSEATRNAVLGSPEHRVKVSLRHASMLPRLAVIDPGLTLGLPPALTAATGCDALAQLIEPFVSTRANPLTDGFCREGLARIGPALRRAYADGSDVGARTELSLAALLGGMALANAGLGAVHGLAGPIGGRFPAPHGAVCGVLLAPVMAANLEALPTGAVAERYAEIARLLQGSASGAPGDAVAWVRRLTTDLEISGLSRYGLARDDAPLVAAAALKTSSMKANPARLSEETLAGIVISALG